MRIIRSKRTVALLDNTGRVVEVVPLKEFAHSSFEARLGLNSVAVDEKTVAERKWQAPKLAPKPQKPCDHGLFSDDAAQLDLVEMFQDPTNGE